MNVVLGGTGHVGSAVVDALLERREPVTLVTRSSARAEPWAKRGAKVAVCDVHDEACLRALLAPATRLYLMVPPADPSSSTGPADEERTLDAILDAIAGRELTKIVAQSTYGARPGTALGDLGLLHRMEQALAHGPILSTCLRGAYFMSNWDSALATAKGEGKVYSFWPTDLRIPMVAPRDVGAVAAAELLAAPASSAELRHVEGPRLYSANDVAAAFARALGGEVVAEEIPPARWTAVLRELGFSEASARSFAAMFATVPEATWPAEEEVVRGPTTLERYVAELVSPAAA